MNEVCRDCGNPADPEQTMRFDDIGKPPLFWCTYCGIWANAMNKALEQAFKERPGFAKQLEQELDKVEKKQN